MARKVIRKAARRSGPPKAPTPQAAPDKALKAIGRRIGILESETATLTDNFRDFLGREAENLSRDSREYQKIHARLAEIDGREERLKAAIETAQHVSKVLERVELGLRPMLLKALRAEQATAPAIPRAAEPVDHIERYYKHLAYQSSLRS